MVVDETLDAGRHMLAGMARQLFVGEQNHARNEYSSPAASLPTGSPSQRTRRRAERKVAIGAGGEARGAGLELGCERLLRGVCTAFGSWPSAL